MIYIKLHDSENGILLAMCDEKLIDSIIEEGNVYINIRDYSDFYRGKLVRPEAADSMIPKQKIYAANLIGTESVRLAMQKKIIKRENVRKADGIEYANAYRMI